MTAKNKNGETITSLYKAVVFDALCGMEEFVVNGVEADAEDFVDKYDHSPETAEPYGCGNMRADVKVPTSEVLRKYNITIGEYQIIAADISDKLSFGRCGWCV